MPKIENAKRIQIEDFPQEDRETVSKIAELYNFFVEQVVNTLNGRVDIENLNRRLIEVEFTVDATGKPIGNNKIGSALGIKGFNVIRVDNLVNPVNFPTSAPFISYTTNGQGIYTINKIGGIPANQKHRIVLEAIIN